jgi:hypothetical protein
MVDSLPFTRGTLADNPTFGASSRMATNWPALAAIAILALNLPTVHSQSTSDGRVQDHVYINSFFKLAYSWPTSLQPVEVSKLNLPTVVPNPNEFLLFSARQVNEPFGVVVMSEKLQVPTQHSPGIRDGADFLDRVIVSSGLSNRGRVLKRTVSTNPDGIKFEELDYVLDAEYVSALTMQSGQWLIAFRCNAKSESDLSTMTKSVLSSRLHP